MRRESEYSVVIVSSGEWLLSGEIVESEMREICE